MGIDNFIYTREKIKAQISSGDAFRTKMVEFLDDNSTNLIFTEDLKNMVHIADKSSDIDLVVKMLKKFNKQNKEIRFGNFIFGPVVMRMLYTFKDEETALKLFGDPEIGTLFDQLISYQILLDLLYEAGRYQDVMNTFKLIKSRQVEGGHYPRHVVVLTFAACFKANTPESLKYATDLWTELQNVGHVPMRKGAAFVAALALKQNAPHIALEIITTVKQQNYMTCRNIKVIALSDLNRPETALPILRHVLEINDPSQMKHTFVQEAITKVKNAIQMAKNDELLQDFIRIEKFLKDNGHIVEQSLDDLLTTEIVAQFVPAVRKDRSVLAANFTTGDNRNQRYNQQNYSSRQHNNSEINNRNRRPGLQDLN